MTARKNWTCIGEDCCNFVLPGSRRKFCTPECRERSERIKVSRTTCSIPGCWSKCRRISASLCEKHYIDQYRKIGPKKRTGPRTKTCPVCSGKFKIDGAWFCSLSCEKKFNDNPFGDNWPCKICKKPIWSVKTYPSREVCWDEYCTSLRTRLKMYEISLEEYSKYVDEYGERCWICGDSEGRVVIDHCHSSGKFRGILCNSHNTAIGSFHDSIEELRKAIEYLKIFGREGDDIG